ATGDLTLNATQGDVNNQNGAEIRANDTLTINAKQDLINTGSSIESANDIVISSRDLTNTSNGLIRANNNITVDWSGILSNTSSKLVAKNTIQTTQNTDGLPNVRSGSLTNASTGLITAQNGTLDLTMGSLTNYGGIGANRVELDTSGVSNSGGSGLIMAKSYLDVRSTGKIDNLDGGSLFSLGGGYLQAKGTITNSSAEIETRGGDLTITANRLINTRTVMEYKYGAPVVGSTKVENFGEALVSENKNYFDLKEILDELTPHGDRDDVSREMSEDERQKRIEQAKKNYPLDMFYEKTVSYSLSASIPYVSNISAEGKILSSGNLTITSDVENYASTITAVKHLEHTGDKIDEAFKADKKTIKSGSEQVRESRKGRCTRMDSADREGASDHCVSWATEYYYGDPETFTDPVVLIPVSLENSTFTGRLSITGKGGTFTNSGTSDTVASLAAQEKASETLGSATDIDFSDPTQAPQAFNNAQIKSRRDAIFDDVFKNLVSSALFNGSSPNPNYLIETNPLLTSYENFISSDYLLNKLTSDSVGRDGKAAVRLGDGFLEQQLVRDQILAFTGFQTIPDSISIEDTYATLMNNAVNSYEDLGLSSGIALSAAQIAQLQKPIVW
ncbi:hypothetical protein, partial [Marinomonas transparens]